MSTYSYSHEGRRFTADTAAMKDAVFVTAQPTNVPLHGMRIPNADIPAVAAELLKAAGQECVIVPKSKAEVRERVGHIVCGSDPVAAVVGLNQRDTSELREKAANYIALAEYIENKGQREADAEKKLQERRDALAAELSEGRRTYGSTGLTAQAAIDRIINLEDGK